MHRQKQKTFLIYIFEKQRIFSLAKVNYYKPRFRCLDDKPILLNDWSARELTILSTTWFSSWHGTHIINLSTYDVLSLWILKPRKATQKNNTKFSIQQFPFRTFWSNFCSCLICDVNEHGCQQLRIKNLFCVAILPPRYICSIV